MSFLGFGKVVDSIGDAGDKLFTSDEERLEYRNKLIGMITDNDTLQIELNKVQSGSKNWFVAGARPAIMWVCTFGLMLAYVLNPLLTLFGIPQMLVPTGEITALIVPLLGVGAMRTFEKMKGLTK
jgi:hypothetical protein